MERVNLFKNPGKEYVDGVKSPMQKSLIVKEFHKAVVRQILLGNRVILPGNITIEIIKHLNDTGKVVPRFGFNYKVKITYDKLKRKKVKFTTSASLERKLTEVLLKTNFDYRLVDYGYQ